MTDFPSIDGAYREVRETVHRHTIRNTFEAGYEVTRSKWTRPIREWQITWSSLSTADLSTLQTFYGTTMQGGASQFVWHHSDSSGTTYMVRFVDDTMTFTSNRKGYWSGNIKIREV
jgi:hypothetical protein